MTTPKGRQRSAGFAVGSMVAITFGTVFVLVNSGGVPSPWPLVIRVIGLLVAVLLVAGLALVVRTESSVTTASLSAYALGGSAAIVGLVAGVGSGTALYAAVGVAAGGALLGLTSVAT